MYGIGRSPSASVSASHTARQRSTVAFQDEWSVSWPPLACPYRQGRLFFPINRLYSLDNTTISNTIPQPDRRQLEVILHLPNLPGERDPFPLTPCIAPEPNVQKEALSPSRRPGCHLAESRQASFVTSHLWAWARQKRVRRRYSNHGIGIGCPLALHICIPTTYPALGSSGRRSRPAQGGRTKAGRLPRPSSRRFFLALP